jgi:GH15 family glucan-1,4-alpha-glucosidase
LGDSEAFFRPPAEIVPAPAAGNNGEAIAESQRRAAIEVLRHCSHEAGLKASGQAYGHQQVWSRDSMIALLGASLVENHAVHRSLRATIRTLARHQSPTGCIPNHVDLATGKPNFRAYADGGLWYVIGSSILQPDYRTVRRVLRWYECQDVDGSGLISIQEASDWQDLFCVRGKALYVNCLHVAALRRAADMAAAMGHPRHAAHYRTRAEAARAAINRRLWYAGDGDMVRHIADSFSTQNCTHDSLGRRRWIPSKQLLADDEYYLPYVSFREPGEWFDTLGNLLAVLCDVADARQASHILNFIARHGLGAHPCPSIYPPVEPGTRDWRDYYGSLNVPHQYHNGGIWPFIGGFYVAALVKAGRFGEAAAALSRLAELNRETGFCEWVHGQTLAPLGVREQAWSAGMYLYASECLATGAVPYL